MFWCKSGVKFPGSHTRYMMEHAGSRQDNVSSGQMWDFVTSVAPGDLGIINACKDTKSPKSLSRRMKSLCRKIAKFFPHILGDIPGIFLSFARAIALVFLCLFMSRVCCRTSTSKPPAHCKRVEETLQVATIEHAGILGHRQQKESVEQAEDPCNRRRRRQLRPSQTRSCETREECHQRIRAQVQERTARVSKERAQVDKAK